MLVVSMRYSIVGYIHKLIGVRGATSVLRGCIIKLGSGLSYFVSGLSDILDILLSVVIECSTSVE